MMYRRTGTRPLTGRREDSPGDDIKFVGARGSIEMITCAWVHVHYNPKELAREVPAIDQTLSYRNNNHVGNFLDSVVSREKPAADVELGCRAATICHISNIAQWLGRPLRWNPDQEEFVGDEEANRWLDRTRREPWDV